MACSFVKSWFYKLVNLVDMCGLGTCSEAFDGLLNSVLSVEMVTIKFSLGDVLCLQENQLIFAHFDF